MSAMDKLKNLLAGLSKVEQEEIEKNLEEAIKEDSTETTEEGAESKDAAKDIESKDAANDAEIKSIIDAKDSKIARLEKELAAKKDVGVKSKSSEKASDPEKTKESEGENSVVAELRKQVSELELKEALNKEKNNVFPKMKVDPRLSDILSDIVSKGAAIDKEEGLVFYDENGVLLKNGYKNVTLKDRVEELFSEEKKGKNWKFFLDPEKSEVSGGADASKQIDELIVSKQEEATVKNPFLSEKLTVF